MPTLILPPVVIYKHGFTTYHVYVLFGQVANVAWFAWFSYESFRRQIGNMETVLTNPGKKVLCGKLGPQLKRIVATLGDMLW